MLSAVWQWSSRCTPGRLTDGIGASIARDKAHRREIEMRTHFKTPARLAMWIAGIATCLLAASGAAAILRWIPPSYTSMPDNRAPTSDEAVPTGVARAQAAVAQTRTTSNHRTRVSCAECGVIESMRQIGSSGDVSGQNIATVPGRVAGRKPVRAIVANVSAVKRYEFTVRFRDGSNRIFNDTSPRAWPLGSRVIVIGGSNSPAG
jgi:outer membrane lipoprotein SlyB